MAEERIDIVVSQRGATEVKRNLEELGRGARESSPSVNALKAAIEAVSSTTDKLKAALGGASAPVRELKRLVDELNKAMESAAATNFAAQISAPIASTGALSAAAIRAAGGIKALGDNFVLLQNSASGALVPVNSAGSALVAISSGASAAAISLGTALIPISELNLGFIALSNSTALVNTNNTSLATSFGPATTAVSTMTFAVSDLFRRLVVLGYMLAALRSSLAGFYLPSGSGPRLITDLTTSFQALPRAAQPASQLLLTFQGAANSTASTVNGPFASAFSRLNGLWSSFTQGIRGVWSAISSLGNLWGSFTQGVRNAWSAVTGLGGGAGGAVPPINNFTGGIGGAGGAASAAVGPVDELTSSFYSLWRILLAVSIIRQVTAAFFDSLDTWTALSNKLRQVSTDQENLIATQEAVYESAQRTRSSIEDIGVLYSRTSAAVSSLGLSQREVMNVTETVAMAMKLNGGTVQETASAMRQLSQAFNKGKLDGDEFRSIMENAPALQRAFSQSLGVTTGQLMEMSKAGELTLPKLIKALQDAGPGIRESFGNTLPLISEGFTSVGNSITRALGRLNEATGFSLTFYNVMKFISDNIGILGVAVAFVGTAILVAFGPAAISALMSFGVALGFATGGLSLILPLLAAAAAAMYVWGDSWTVTEDGITALDYIRAALQIVSEYALIAADYLYTGFSQAWTYVSETWGQLSEFFGIQFNDIGSLLRTAISYYIGAWIGLYNSIIAVYERLPSAIYNIMKLGMNAVIDLVQGTINSLIESINSILTYVDLDPIQTLDWASFRAEIDSTTFDVGTRISDAFSQGLDEGKALVDGVVSGLEGAVTRLTERARQISEERRKLEANRPQLSDIPGLNTYELPTDSEEGGIGRRGGSGTKGKSAQDTSINLLEKLQTKLDALIQTLDPLAAAQEKVRQSTIVLNLAYEAGLISMDRRDDLLNRLAESMRDQLDPLGKLNRDMEQEARLLRMGNEEREIQKQLLQDIERLKGSGVTLAPLERQQLEDNIRSMAALKEQSQLLGDVLDRVFKGAEDAFVQFIETGKVNFSSLIKSMISDISRMAFQSFVTKPLTNALQGAMGGMLGGAGQSQTGASGGNLFSGFGSLFGFATGGGFTVGGAGGVDSQVVAFRASPGERVSVSRANEESSGGSRPQIIFNITTQDAKSFKASETQIAARMARLASRGNRNM